MFRTSRTAKSPARVEPAPQAAGPAQTGPAQKTGPLADGDGGIGYRPALRRISRADRRSLHIWYSSADLPLFGLPPDWTGYRCPGQRAGRQPIRRSGPFGMLNRPGGPLWIAALGLTHMNHDGGRLHVASHRVRTHQTLEAMAAGNFSRRLAWPLLQQGDREASDKAVIAKRKQYRSGEFGWRRAVIHVDAEAVDLYTLTTGADWVALAEMGGVCLQLDAHRFPIGRVRLVRIYDPAPYLTAR